MPELSSARPRLFTIPPSAPFLSTLAKALLAGDLPVPGGPKPEPLTLPLTTIYLPTRRAARALREAFLAEAPAKAMLLPRIRALGDPDEEATIIFGSDDAAGDFDAVAGKPAIGQLPRRLALMRLVMAFRHLLRNEAEASRGVAAPPLLEVTPGQASYLAADLARLMDFIESEEIALEAIEAIVPEDLAAHWQLTVDFLKIVTEHWPRFLDDNGLVSPLARRNALMRIETERLAKGAPYPVIAAGSTGTIPATARLLQTIASLPNGAVVLPGLDKLLDEESWTSLDEHPEHPQAGMAELLRKLGVTREEVADLPGAAPGGLARARLHFVSEALRPAESTERWQTYLEGDDLAADGRASLANALAGMCLVVAPTAHDEAEAIALILKSCAESPRKTTALVTPDRILARRVAARLKGYGLAIDDSAGVPAARTVPGAFLDLILAAAETGFAPRELMALLKHPLTLVGRSPGEIRFAARALERGVFRNIYVGQGIDGVVRALKTARTGSKRGHRITDGEHEAASKLVRNLKAAFAPLSVLFASPSLESPSRFAEAHAAVAEALAADESGSPAALWQDDGGEALTVFLAELINIGSSLTMMARDYPPFYRSLVAGATVRPCVTAHPRLFIWGPLEARLQQPDVIILGSLNEGVWPRPQEAGPWLSRPMREKLGLSPPERRIGLSAHDFVQALGAERVYLTRAQKVDGVPTVASRWLQRLLALIEAAKLSHRIAPEEPWIGWARERDSVTSFEPVKAPRPCPPASARPPSLSVTRIGRWIANPYEIFAKNILKLEPLKPLGAEPDPAMRGSIIHRALQEFSAAYPNELPPDVAAKLIAYGDRHFAALGGSPRVAAFWRPQLERFARWFAATEPLRRASIRAIHTEADGALDLKVGAGFRLTARADRIDVAEDGSVAIYDYKTGKPPLAMHVDRLFEPQLPLEAVIAERAGFADLGKLHVSRLGYIEVSGRNDGGAERDAGNRDAGDLAREAYENLVALVERYADPTMPYEVKRRKAAAFARAYDYDEYEHLARVKEWLTQDDEEWR
ncbi:MAG: double-strand break repair protein AddB [Methyloceanibacter sp.]